MLNANSTWGTAILRSAYLAIGSFLVAFLPAWAVTDELKGPFIAGALAALWALGFRGVVEGSADAGRDAAGKRLPGDVGMPNADGALAPFR